LRREAQWWAVRNTLSRERTSDPLPFTVLSHDTPLMRRLPRVDMELQANKVLNLRIAADRLDGLVLGPGERLSFRRCVGPPSKCRGRLTGLMLRFGIASRNGIIDSFTMRC
jgi:vancomycin resistance protein VanW